MDKITNWLDGFVDAAGLGGVGIFVLSVIAGVVLVGGTLSYIIVRHMAKSEGVKPISEADAITPDPTVDIYDESLEMAPTWKTWVIVLILVAVLVYITVTA